MLWSTLMFLSCLFWLVLVYLEIMDVRAFPVPLIWHSAEGQKGMVLGCSFKICKWYLCQVLLQRAVQLCWFPIGWEQLLNAHAVMDTLTNTIDISSGDCQFLGSLGLTHTLFCSAVHLTSAVTMMCRQVPLSLPKREPEDRAEAWSSLWACVLLHCPWDTGIGQPQAGHAALLGRAVADLREMNSLCLSNAQYRQY